MQRSLVSLSSPEPLSGDRSPSVAECFSQARDYLSLVLALHTYLHTGASFAGNKRTSKPELQVEVHLATAPPSSKWVGGFDRTHVHRLGARREM